MDYLMMSGSLHLNIFFGEIWMVDKVEKDCKSLLYNIAPTYDHEYTLNSLSLFDNKSR